ncbi:tRNA (adenine(22)-N(1))-methyltransferase [Aneurinibacillus terranovensis]|uniref:tRNA (adenine(22)-N(1))-methyltransferase n=1 Tax=Aneurinibacillus terranovensis TaxID=278991 RepID=UPI0003F6AC88|nr:class I SAM-dependent methyltransferase [Aneurinibacillus terranovensis]
MIEISQRLQTIANMVTPGHRAADIGSDHAYLPTYLIEQNISPFCIAGEVNKGPYESAAKQVRAAGLTENIEVRLGDGLAVVHPGEADTVCIAGMGGSLIVSILGAGLEGLNIKELILQPNVAAPLVRRWLMNNGWEITAEKIIEEDNVIYEIMRAVPGDGKAPYTGQDRTFPELLEIGPFLWREKSPVLRKKWQEEKNKLLFIQRSMMKSQAPETERKKQEITEKIKWIEGVIECLPADNA